LLRVTGTCAPLASFRPGRLPCLRTRPFFTFGENALVSLPKRQRPFASAFFAAGSVLFASFGTTHFGLGGGRVVSPGAAAEGAAVPAVPAVRPVEQAEAQAQEEGTAA
jgi:hypothetical protein